MVYIVKLITHRARDFNVPLVQYKHLSCVFVNIKFNRDSTMGDYNCKMEAIGINTLTLSILDV